LDDIFPNKWNTNFTFINNSVIASYNAIFANILRPCLNFYVEKPCEHIFLYDPPFYYQPLLPNHIATSPLLFTFAGNNSTLLCIVPGEVYDLQVHLLVGLFYIIMAFNVKLTSGPASAFLFFSQIILSAVTTLSIQIL